MDHQFQILLLGVPELVWQSRPFTLARRQARALLYYLADELQSVPRDRLTFLLWPDAAEATARRNLTRLLSYTRQALPRPDLLQSDKTAVALNPDLVSSDTVQFAELCVADDPTGWETAVSLFHGRFLDGFTLPDSPEFDQWLSQAQRQYERAYLDLLHKLVTAKADNRDHPSAIHYAQQYLTTDDLAEEIHRQLISLYAATGDRSAALRQFEQCATVLERELGVPPLPETRAAYEAARDGTQPLPPELLPKPEWTTLPGLDLPLIGRDDAWQALTEAYRRFQNGGVIFISGEAGVGKSRLMEEFATVQTGLVLTGNSHATGQALPYQPLLQALRLALPLRDRWSHTLSVWLAEVSRLLPELHERFPDLPSPVEVAPQQAQARQFEALTEVFGSLGTNSPLLLCLDDVHWADEATLGWLQYTTNRLANSSVCILTTYRTQEAAGLTEWQRALSRAGQSENIKLTGLSETAVTDLLGKAGADRTTSTTLAGRIHASTGGNAFFVLETIRELLESGQSLDDLTDLPLPQTVRDAVLRRVARLTPLAQQIVAVAAVLSPNLRIETLVEISGRAELETAESLEELLSHQLLQADGHSFRFQHDLARQAVYEDISPWRRRLLHRRAAEGLEQLYQSDLTSFYPSLAHHWSRVVEDETTDPALVSKAIEYLQKAGVQAARSSMNLEAINSLTMAVALLERFPETPERAGQELRLQLALSGPLMTTKGYAAPETVETFNRARLLAAQTGDTSQVFRLLYGKWVTRSVQAIHRDGLEAAEQFLSLAQQQAETGMMMMGHRMVGTSMMYKGQLSLARNHLDQALALFDPSAHKLLTFQFGQHPGAASEALLSVTLWLLGYPDQASSISNKAITLARQLDHVNTFGYVLSFGQLVSQMARNVSQVEKLAEIVISYAKEHKLALYLGASTMMQGWALINRGEAAESVSRVSNGLAAWRATGANLFVSQFQAYLVEGYLALGQIKDGLETVQDILSFVKESDEHYWEAEIYRLQGELQRRQGQETKAETGFQQAIAVAQQQNAKSLELRASVSLARLYQQRGKRIEAYHMLAEIFNWFTEGFDTVDLKEARALLEELRLGTIPGPS